MFARLSIATGIFATLLVGLLVMAPSDALAACAPSTSPYIVTLYKDDDCEGTPLVLDSDTPNLTQTVPVLNDASALVIGKNVSVTLYEDANYGKKNICWNGPKQIDKLNAFPISPGNGWGDDPSSVKVGAAGACTNPGVTSVGCVSSAASGSVTLYEDDDCGGTSLGLNTNTTDLSKTKPPLNNASSLVVGDNATVFLYEHKGYEGSRICWNGPYTANKLDDFEFVGGSSWNDVPSSVTFGGECANPGETVQVDDGCGSGISGVFCRLGTVGNIVKNLPVVIPTAFLVIIVTLVASLASLLASAVKFFFIWFAKEAINIPVNSENPFVEQGFHISLTIVNSLFVLILVIIGLATILRFQRYQFQKLLPTFFIVALLINFSGVFVGFIVDIGNILTNVFLSRIASFETVAQQVGSLGGDLLSFVSSPGFDELFGNLVEIIAKSVILLVYNAILLIVLLILLLIFVVRASILSLLAVLSPLAFAAYILPATRGFFEQWWKQLIQWSFIGAPIAFFLYLSNLFLTTGGGFPKGGLEGAGALGEVIYGIITPLASLILLIAGIGISMQMAPAGAQGVINFGKKWGAVAGKYAGAQTLGRALATKKGADAAKNLTKTGLGVLSRKELGARWKDAGFLGKAGLAARFAVNPSLVSMRWGIRQAGKQALQYGAKQPQAIDRRVGEFEKQFGKDYDRAAATYATLGSLDYEGKIALALYLAKVKGGKGISKLIKEQQREVVKQIAQYAPSKLEDIIKHVPNLIDDLGVGGVGELIQNTMIPDVKPDIQGKYKDADVQKIFEVTGVTDAKTLLREATYKKAAQAMNAVDFENADTSIMDNAKFREHIARWQPWNIIRKIGEEWGAEMIGKLQDEAETVGLASIARTNASFINSAYTPQGSVFMRDWIHPTTHASMGGRDVAKAFVADARRSPYAAPPATKTVEENAMIDRLANTVFASMPPTSPRTLADIRTKVEREYDGQYRVRTHEQLFKNQDLFDWRADREFGGDQNQAREAYREEIFTLLRRKEQNPPPQNISSKEEKIMDSIARGGAMPKPSDPQRGKKLLGAFYKTATLLNEAESNIGRLSKEIFDVESRGGNASPQRMSRADWERSYDAHKTKLSDLTRELNI